MGTQTDLKLKTILGRVYGDPKGLFDMGFGAVVLVSSLKLYWTSSGRRAMVVVHICVRVYMGVYQLCIYV